MAKWTDSKIIDDNWSVKECVDELYELIDVNKAHIGDTNAALTKSSLVVQDCISNINVLKDTSTKLEDDIRHNYYTTIQTNHKIKSLVWAFGLISLVQFAIGLYLLFVD